MSEQRGRGAKRLRFEGEAQDLRCPCGPVRMPTWAALLLLAMVSVAVFHRAVGYGFIDWDDNTNVYENVLLNPPSVRNTVRFWREPAQHDMYPLTYTVWAAENALSHVLTGRYLDARVFHVSNLALHVLAVWMVYALLMRYLRNLWPTAESNQVGWGACAGALLFAVHPVQVEAVAWVTGGKDVLAGLLALLAIHEFLAYAGHGCGQPVRGGRLRLAGATLWFVLSLCAKPTAAVAPLLAALLVSGFTMHSDGEPRSCWRMRAVWGPLLGWCAVALPWVLLTKYTQRNEILEFVAPVWMRLFIAGDALLFYLGKLIWPVRLGLDYGRAPAVLAGQPWFYVRGCVPWCVCAAFGVRAWMRRRDPRVRSGHDLPWWHACLWFMVAALPVMGLVPFKYQNMSTVADRYLYIAMVGPALAVAGLFARVVTGRRVGAVCLAAGACLLCLGTRAFDQVKVWRGTIPVFRHGLAVNPASWTLGNNLGVLLAKDGDIEAGIVQFSRVLKRYERNVDAHLNLGNAFGAMDSLDAATVHYRRAMEIDPEDPDVPYNLALVLVRQGDIVGAVRHYSEALALEPHYLNAHVNLAALFLEKGRLAESARHLGAARELAPDDEDVLQLERMLGSRGREPSARTLEYH